MTNNMSNMSNKFYAVKIGREGPKIYHSWAECSKNVTGHPGAKFKSFGKLDHAQAFIAGTMPTLISTTPNVETIIVYTDGSCRYQGTEQAVAGAGVYFPQLKITYSCRVPGHQTNNRGELHAVIQALKIICHHDLYDSQIVEIHTDSTYVMDNIESNHLANLDLWAQMHEYLQKIPVKWVKVLAHAGDPWSEYVDKLAKNATM